MSDDEMRSGGNAADEGDDQVKAHLRRTNEEAGDEARRLEDEGDDEVKAHVKSAGMTGDGGGDDEVKAHVKGTGN